MHVRPKRYRNHLDLSHRSEGRARRENYAKEILRKAPTLPLPLEYKDIDESMVEFVDKILDLSIAGKKVPTFTLFSNQRFSEYSQTWQYTDEEGNLIMNFKTVSRNTDVGKGKNQGENFVIPGERRYEIGRRTVLDDNGTEHFEVISMKQPYTVDLSFRVGFVTDKMEELNRFNMMVNETFKSIQHYIRPNGHFLPVVLDGVSDETQYSIEDRKFFSQTVTLKVLAYIIHEDDYRVDMIPKRDVLMIEGFSGRKKAKVTVEEEDVRAEYTETRLDVTVRFEEYDYRAEFNIDTDMHVDGVETENVRQVRIHVNGTPYYHEKGFELKNGDTVRLKVIQYDDSKPCNVVFHGWIPKEYKPVNSLPEFVSDEISLEEEIIVE